MSMLSLVFLEPTDPSFPNVTKNIPNKSQVIKASDLLLAKFAFGSCSSSLINPKAKFKAVRSDIIGRHKHIAVLCLVLLQPVDALLPQVINNTPNESQFVKTVDLLLAKLASGLCHTFLIHPTPKFIAFRSDTIARHKYMSMLSLVFLEPTDPSFPNVIKNIPNKSQVIKASDLLFAKFAFGLCQTFLADPKSKFKAVRTLKFIWHK